MNQGNDCGLNELVAQHQMIPPGSAVLCAVSGGADSIYLLHRLYNLFPFRGFTVIAAHYNHHLRGEESLRDEGFVRDFVGERCGERNIMTDGKTWISPPVELIVGSGDVLAQAKRLGRGVEETARSMRYAFLEETAQRLGCDRIATAHTADDNAETLMLNLTRGAGLHGLTGIPPVRGRLIRPLLTTQRKTIERYLMVYRIPHVEDSTNADDAYSRNRVRHQIIPLLNQINPWFIPRTAQTIDYLREDDSYLQDIADKLVAQVVHAGDTLTLPAAALGDQPNPIATRMARRILSRLEVWQYGAAHLSGVVDLCRSADPSAVVDLPHGLMARRVYGDLVIGPQAAPSPLPTLALDPGEPWVVEIGDWRFSCSPTTAPEEIPVDPSHGFLSRSALEGGLTLRPRQTGDAIALPKRGRRTLKKLLINAKLPRLERDRLPILADEAGPLCVPGFGFDSPHLAHPGEAALEMIVSSKEKSEVNDNAGQ